MIPRLKGKIKEMDTNEVHEPTRIASSESLLEDTEDRNEMVSKDDTPPTPGVSSCKLINWSPVDWTSFRYSMPPEILVSR